MFRFGQRQAVELSAQVFNLFNSDNYTGYQQFIPPLPEVNENFGEPTREDPKRRFQFGVVVPLLSGPVMRAVTARRSPWRRSWPARRRRLHRPFPAPRPLRRATPFAPGGPLPALFDDIQARTFRFFWERYDPGNGPRPRPLPEPVAVEHRRGGLRPDRVPDRRRARLRDARRRGGARPRDPALLRRAPQGPEPTGRTGHRGFFYHFLDMKTGLAQRPDVELSTIDTTLLLAGMLFCQSYFDRAGAGRAGDPRAGRAHLRRASTGPGPRRDPPIVSMGWRPEIGHYDAEWRIYDESMILYVLALGSPTHPLPDTAWRAYTADRAAPRVPRPGRT